MGIRRLVVYCEGHLAEDEDVVGTTAPDASHYQHQQQGGVEEAEVEEDGGGDQPQEGVDELAHHKDDLGLHLVGMVDLTGCYNSNPGTSSMTVDYSNGCPPGADVHGDDVHGVAGTLGQVAQAGHQLRVLVDDGVLDVEVGRLPGQVEHQGRDQHVPEAHPKGVGVGAARQDAPTLDVASERRHYVDVEARHLVQTVEDYGVLPGKDGDG